MARKKLKLTSKTSKEKIRLSYKFCIELKEEKNPTKSNNTTSDIT